MTIKSSKDKWIEAGYEYFAFYGPEQLQIEKIARYLNLNKSGYYHYFGEREIFIDELLNYHKKRIEIFARGITKLKSFDEYIQYMVDNKQTTLFHVQLRRHGQIKCYAKIIDSANNLIFANIKPLWAEYIGLQNNPDLAMKYFNQVISVFVKSVNQDNLTIDFITSIAREAQELLKQLQKTKD